MAVERSPYRRRILDFIEIGLKGIPPTPSAEKSTLRVRLKHNLHPESDTLRLETWPKCRICYVSVLQYEKE